VASSLLLVHYIRHTRIDATMSPTLGPWSAQLHPLPHSSPLSSGSVTPARPSARNSFTDPDGEPDDDEPLLPGQCTPSRSGGGVGPGGVAVPASLPVVTAELLYFAEAAAGFPSLHLRSDGGAPSSSSSSTATPGAGAGARSASESPHVGATPSSPAGQSATPAVSYADFIDVLPARLEACCASEFGATTTSEWNGVCRLLDKLLFSGGSVRGADLLRSVFGDLDVGVSFTPVQVIAVSAAAVFVVFVVSVTVVSCRCHCFYCYGCMCAGLS
jgi:hypothetical protein